MRASRGRLRSVLSLRLTPDRFVASQLRQPSGLFGRWAMTRLLNRYNAELITATVDALELRGERSFLDLGFGGGLALRLAAGRTTGPLWGVDVSSDVVLAGMRTFAAEIAGGRLNLLRADVADLPLRDGLLDAIASANTIYFWPDPLRALRSLARVLSPGGTLAIGYNGASKMREFAKITRHGFNMYEPDRVEALLREAGFADVATRAQHGRVSRGDYVSVATKRGGDGLGF